MNAAARRLGDRWFAAAPAPRLAMFRILVGAFATLYCSGRLLYWVQVSRLPAYRWKPIGLAAWVSQPPPRLAVLAAAVVAIGLGVAFTAGWRYRFSGPAFALAALGLTTYGNSWGHVFHSENLFVVHLLILAAAPAADAWSADARRPGPHRLPEETSGAAGYGWPLRLASVVTVIAYGLAGWAKLRLGGLDWVTGDVLRYQVAHDNLRKALVGDTYSPLGARLAARGWLWRPIAGFTVLAEFAGPVALVWRPLRRWWAGAIWAFHAGIVALMAIVFAYPLSGIAFASLFELERLPRAARAGALRCLPWLRRQRRHASA